MPLARSIVAERTVRPPDESDGSRHDRNSAREKSETPLELQDTAAAHGVEEDDLTPDIHGAMVGLIAEVATLREELDQNSKRLEYLTMLADQDPVSLVLNRRAFVRELSRALMIAQRRDTGSALVFIEIENLTAINTRLGLAAGDAIIEHVAGIVQNHVPNGDVVGRVGGGEFGVILIGEQAESARIRSEALAAAIFSRPLVWENAEIPVELKWGIHLLDSTEDANAAMNAADREMRAAAVAAES